MACSTNGPWGTTASPGACSMVKESKAAGRTVPSWAASAYRPTWVVSKPTSVDPAVTHAVPFHQLLVIVSPTRASRSRSALEPGRSEKPTALKVASDSTSVSMAVPDGDSPPTKVRPDRT